MSESGERFARICREIHDLAEIGGFLEWDQAVMMPAKGAQQRGFQQAALARVIHGMWKSRELGDLIDGLEGAKGQGPDLEADLREAKRRRDRAMNVPDDLVAERARVCTVAQSIWETAREKDDFASFLPHLEEVIRLTREVASCVDGERPYDALLDEYEPGATEAGLTPLFARLKDRTVALLDAIRGASRPPVNGILKTKLPIEGQEGFVRKLAGDMGYDWSAGRLDRSVHPFTIGTHEDVRITARFDAENLATGLFATLHETGHALYEQGLDPDRYRDPAGRACSLGIHESQSRFWENIVGRSLPYWRRYLPVLAQSFPGRFDGVTPEEFHRAVNVCEPSLIRVEADEVTYNLHVILRFELERGIVNGDISVADLPGAWNEGMKRLLGVEPPDYRTGVLQDVHWSAGLIGYFPTYALGNLYAAQFAEALVNDMPDLDDRVGEGRLIDVREWLREKIHRHGRRFLPGDLCRRVTGRPLSEEPSMKYLERKFRDIYGVNS